MKRINPQALAAMERYRKESNSLSNRKIFKMITFFRFKVPLTAKLILSGHVLKQYNSSVSNGYILPIVLFVVIILISGGLFSLHIAKQKISNSTDLMDAVEAQIEAENQLEIIKFYTSSGKFRGNRVENDALRDIFPFYPDTLYLDNREQNLTSNYTIRLQDTAGLINIMYPDAQTISYLLNHIGNKSSSDVLADSISDWFDEDDFHRLNGAEYSYYQAQKDSIYTPRNLHLTQSPEELKLIRGLKELSPEEWNYVKRYMIFPGGSSFNVMTAPIELLGAKLQIPEEERVGIEALRERDFEEFKRYIQTSSNFNPETIGILPSQIVRANITVKKNNSKATVKALIDCSGVEENPTKTIGYY